MAANQLVLSWTDALGAATLSNGRPGIAARARGWTPLPAVNMATVAALSGRGYGFKFGDLYDARFELPFIAHADHPTAARFVRHAANLGTFQVATGDAAARVYPSCQCAVSGTDVAVPTLEMTDRRLRWWTLTLPRVRNIATGAGAVELICLYP